MLKLLSATIIPLIFYTVLGIIIGLGGLMLAFIIKIGFFESLEFLLNSFI